MCVNCCVLCSINSIQSSGISGICNQPMPVYHSFTLGREKPSYIVTQYNFQTLARNTAENVLSDSTSLPCCYLCDFQTKYVFQITTSNGNPLRQLLNKRGIHVALLDNAVQILVLNRIHLKHKSFLVQHSSEPILFHSLSSKRPSSSSASSFWRSERCNVLCLFEPSFAA